MGNGGRVSRTKYKKLRGCGSKKGPDNLLLRTRGNYAPRRREATLGRHDCLQHTTLRDPHAERYLRPACALLTSSPYLKRGAIKTANQAGGAEVVKVLVYLHQSTELCDKPGNWSNGELPDRWCLWDGRYEILITPILSGSRFEALCIIPNRASVPSSGKP